MSRTKAKQDQTRFDVSAAIVSAHALLKLSDVLFESVRRSGAKPSTAEIGDIVASATNRALAVELYLKALLVTCSQAPSTDHDLAKLYKRLPPDVKSSCTAVYKSLPQAGRTDTVLFTIDVSGDKAKLLNTPVKRGPTDHSISAVLARCKDAFRIWRYFYERHVPDDAIVTTNYEFHYLGNAAAAFHQVAINKGGTVPFKSDKPL